MTLRPARDRKDRADCGCSHRSSIGCWPGLKAEWSQENHQQDVHDQRNGKRQGVSGEFHDHSLPPDLSGDCPHRPFCSGSRDPHTRTEERRIGHQVGQRRGSERASAPVSASRAVAPIPSSRRQRPPRSLPRSGMLAQRMAWVAEERVDEARTRRCIVSMPEASPANLTARVSRPTVGDVDWAAMDEQAVRETPRRMPMRCWPATSARPPRR